MGVPALPSVRSARRRCHKGVSYHREGLRGEAGYRVFGRGVGGGAGPRGAWAEKRTVEDDPPALRFLPAHRPKAAPRGQEQLRSLHRSIRARQTRPVDLAMGPVGPEGARFAKTRRGVRPMRRRALPPAHPDPPHGSCRREERAHRHGRRKPRAARPRGAPSGPRASLPSRNRRRLPRRYHCLAPVIRMLLHGVSSPVSASGAGGAARSRLKAARWAARAKGRTTQCSQVLRAGDRHTVGSRFQRGTPASSAPRAGGGERDSGAKTCPAGHCGPLRLVYGDGSAMEGSSRPSWRQTGMKGSSSSRYVRSGRFEAAETCGLRRADQRAGGKKPGALPLPEVDDLWRPSRARGPRGLNPAGFPVLEPAQLEPVRHNTSGPPRQQARRARRHGRHGRPRSERIRVAFRQTRTGEARHQDRPRRAGPGSPGCRKGGRRGRVPREVSNSKPGFSGHRQDRGSGCRPSWRWMRVRVKRLVSRSACRRSCRPGAFTGASCAESPKGIAVGKISRRSSYWAFVEHRGFVHQADVEGMLAGVSSRCSEIPDPPQGPTRETGRTH